MYSSRGLGAIIISTIFVTLATAVVGLRLYVRGRVIHTIGIEDWLALATVVSSIAVSGVYVDNIELTLPLVPFYSSNCHHLFS